MRDLKTKYHNGRLWWVDAHVHDTRGGAGLTWKATPRYTKFGPHYFWSAGALAVEIWPVAGNQSPTSGIYQVDNMSFTDFERAAEHARRKREAQYVTAKALVTRYEKAKETKEE